MAESHSIEGEQWKAIPGFEGRYEASTHGRVRSLRFRNGTSDHLLAEPRLLVGGMLHGYRRIYLGRTKRSVHTLILETFVGPRPIGYMGAHQNGNRTDNRLENLRWASPAENAGDTILHDRWLGGKAPRKLTSAQHAEIRNRRCAGEALRALAEDYGVTVGAIEYIVRKRVQRKGDIVKAQQERIVELEETCARLRGALAEIGVNSIHEWERAYAQQALKAPPSTGAKE